MDKLNIRVLIKEPRGFVRILQILFSIIAWSSTAGFATISTLHIFCPETPPYKVEYKIDYPFDLRNTEISAPENCSDDAKVIVDKFPIDFSSTSMLFVLICFVSLIYAISSAIYYSLFTAKYETDPLAPMVDLCITLLFTILWIAITITWALNVSDLKHYTNPNNFKDHLPVCHDDSSEANCQPSNPGKWTSLTVSIYCGFTCVILWLGSTWFTFKETTLHKNKQATYQQNQPTTTAPPQTNQM